MSMIGNGDKRLSEKPEVAAAGDFGWGREAMKSSIAQPHRRQQILSINTFAVKTLNPNVPFSFGFPVSLLSGLRGMTQGLALADRPAKWHTTVYLKTPV